MIMRSEESKGKDKNLREEEKAEKKHWEKFKVRTGDEVKQREGINVRDKGII